MDAIKLSVIAPTYNEADNVEPLLRRLDESLQGIDFEVIICDDDSPDLTWARAEQIGSQDSRLRVLRRRGKRGLGHAVVDGFSAARNEAVACIDADLQHDPTILPKMLSQLQAGCDLVIGSRYVPGGGTKNWSLIRRLESWLATKLAQLLLRIDLHDPMSGYFMLRREEFLRVRPYLNPDGFKILLEIAAHMTPSRLAEVPYVFRERERGESKLSSLVVLSYVRQLWRLFILQRRLSPN
jgi:dolichol-phosphate mannosyltransferase